MPPEVRFESTPNPNALRCVFGDDAGVQPTRSFRTREQAAADPLADRLMSIPGVDGLLIARGWLTISKSPRATWKELRPAITRAIADAG